MADTTDTTDTDVGADELAATEGTDTNDVEEDLLIEEVSIDGMCGVY